MASTDSDAEYARQLQEEEFAAAGIRRPSLMQAGTGSGAHRNSGSDVRLDLHESPRAEPNVAPPVPVNRPLLAAGANVLGAAAAARPEHREVHANAAQQAQLIQEHSPTLFGIYCAAALIELILAIVVLAKGWDQECNKPLRVFVLIYSGRWLLMLPISILRYRNRHRVYSPQHPDMLLKWSSWIKFFALVWMVIGQYWYFTADDSFCMDTAPWVAKFTLALIVVFYVTLFLPLILLLLLCLCLPCALILLQFFQPDTGAKPEQIQAIPKRTYQPPREAAEGTEPPSCAICMEDFKAGDELRHLPCEHEFHVSCVDRWLGLNHSCPLCRRNLTVGAEVPNEAEARV